MAEVVAATMGSATGETRYALRCETDEKVGSYVLDSTLAGGQVREEAFPGVTLARVWVEIVEGGRKRRSMSREERRGDMARSRRRSEGNEPSKHNI